MSRALLVLVLGLGLSVTAPPEARAGEPATPPEAPAKPKSTAAEESKQADERPDGVYDYKISLGGYFANFDQEYGFWAGAHARFWVLDVTGQRRWSLFVELADLHWRPDRITDLAGDADAEYFVVRFLRHWHEKLYTFFTMSGTIGDPVYPRFHAEAEADWITPVEGLVFSFGLSYRFYPGIHRPLLMFGLSYSLPYASFTYRFYTGAGMAAQTHNTHLLIWTVGERLKYWLRVELLWGDENHPHFASAVPRLINADVESKSITLHFEQWIEQNWGITYRFRWSEGTVKSIVRFTFHYWQVGLRPFITF